MLDTYKNRKNRLDNIHIMESIIEGCLYVEKEEK